MYCNTEITEDVAACKEQQLRHSTLSRVVLFCSSHAVTSSVIYYSTHTQKNVIYLLNILFLVTIANILCRFGSE